MSLLTWLSTCCNSKFLLAWRIGDDKSTEDLIKELISSNKELLSSNKNLVT